MNMSLKHLSRMLSKLLVFSNPIIGLEQYATSGEVAAELLWSSHMRNLIKDKVVIDLGAGTGILGIGALLLGAKKVVFLEKDSSAIRILEKNIKNVEEEYELPSFEIIQGDVSSITGIFDFVIMNPPFGTKNKNVDTTFLNKAVSLSDNVLSIHKTSTKDYVVKYFEDNEFEVVDVFDFKYHLKKLFEHHDKPVKIIEISGFLGKRIK
ncbi:METTL5 family protein [Candidatus Woesearchaeota archaeon]|nr:METTL5 family protein [Candidatus Woesearchaeota archaeon]